MPTLVSQALMAGVENLDIPTTPRSLIYHFQNPSKDGSVTASQSFTETP